MLTGSQVDLARLSGLHGSIRWILGHVFRRENLKTPSKSNEWAKRWNKNDGKKRVTRVGKGKEMFSVKSEREIEVTEYQKVLWNTLWRWQFLCQREGNTSWAHQLSRDWEGRWHPALLQLWTFRKSPLKENPASGGTRELSQKFRHQNLAWWSEGARSGWAWCESPWSLAKEPAWSQVRVRELCGERWRRWQTLTQEPDGECQSQASQGPWSIMSCSLSCQKWHLRKWPWPLTPPFSPSPGWLRLTLV